MRNEFVGSNRDISAALPLPRMRNNADEALIEKVASGNRLAMQVLFVRHQARIYRFIVRLVGGDNALAEDLTSEVFLSAWRHAHQFEGRSAVATWLLAIARYKALGELRRRPEPISREEDVEITDPADNPEALFEIKHRGELLRKCLTRLSREHREIIDLVYYHEKSVQEVAEIVGIPGNTVKTRMFYARRKLSELLAAEGVVGAWS